VIDDGRILLSVVNNTECHLLLLNVDFDQLNCLILSDVRLNFVCVQIVTDSLDSSHFVLRNLRSLGNTTIWKGRVIEDQIHVDAQGVEAGAELDGFNLMGNQLFALRRSQENRVHWHYTQYDLSLNVAHTVTESPLIECPTALNGYSKVVWSNDKMYAVFYFEKTFSIMVFDSELYKWSTTRFIGNGGVQALAIDENDVLTVSASEYPEDYPDDDSIEKTVYRLPMRKPDKLRYLAWNTIRRGAFFFDSDIYDNLVLPYNSEFRSYFEPQ